MRAIAGLMLFAGMAGAAPVPRERPLSADELCGCWAYTWNGTPGEMWLSPCGAYLARHGSADRPNYAGAWWVRDGRVVISEYVVCCDGMQRREAIRFEFGATRTGAGYELRGTSTVKLFKGGER